MKTFITIVTIGLMSMPLLIAAKTQDTKNGWEPKANKKSSVFKKTDRKFKGAKVEILQMNGEVIAEQTLLKRRVIIDFEDVKDGEYTIRITKGNDIKEFQFVKS
jgi:hypothetical protein